NTAGSVISNGATLAVNATGAIVSSLRVDSEPLAETASSDTRLMNLSVRAAAGSGANTLIVGFAVSGNANQKLLIRGTGPALSEFQIPNVLPDPSLTVYAGLTLVATN